VKLKNVRGSFLHVVKPQERRNDAKVLTGWNFNGSFLVPKKLDDGVENPQVLILRDAMKTALEGTWPGQNKKIPAERRCVRDGEPKDEDTGERAPLYEGYEGCFFVSANRGVSIEEWELIQAGKKDWPVQLLGPRKGPDGKFPRLKGADAAALFYSGAYFDVILRVYGYDGKGENPDRINASLEAIKFKRHGDAFGSKPVDADSAFDEEEDDELDDDLTAGSGTQKPKKDDDDDMLG
jgi:hypothetical protein